MNSYKNKKRVSVGWMPILEQPRILPWTVSSSSCACEVPRKHTFRHNNNHNRRLPTDRRERCAGANMSFFLGAVRDWDSALSLQEQGEKIQNDDKDELDPDHTTYSLCHGTILQTFGTLWWRPKRRFTTCLDGNVEVWILVEFFSLVVSKFYTDCSIIYCVFSFCCSGNGTVSG